MKIVKTKSNENCHFYSREKSLYVAWTWFRNVINLLPYSDDCDLQTIYFRVV